MKTTIIRLPKEAGNFFTIPKSIVNNENLTSDSLKLLLHLLNNSEDWEINLQYYSKKFKWNGHKQSRVVKNLVDTGYLRRKKITQPEGYTYVYSLSEYGNLNDVAQPEEVTPTSTIQPIIELKIEKESLPEITTTVLGLSKLEKLENFNPEDRKLRFIKNYLISFKAKNEIEESAFSQLVDVIVDKKDFFHFISLMRNQNKFNISLFNVEIAKAK